MIKYTRVPAFPPQRCSPNQAIHRQQLGTSGPIVPGELHMARVIRPCTPHLILFRPSISIVIVLKILQTPTKLRQVGSKTDLLLLCYSNFSPILTKPFLGYCRRCPKKTFRGLIMT